MEQEKDPTAPTLDELIERQRERLEKRQQEIEEMEKRAAEQMRQEYLRRTGRA